MISEADRSLRYRLGRAAYLYTGMKNLSARRMKATVEVDGERFFKGRVSCVLAGKRRHDTRRDQGLPRRAAGRRAPRARRGRREEPVEWARTFGKLALGRAKESRFAEVTHGKKFTIRFDRKVPYELDGGARPARKDMRIKARPGSITICAADARPGATLGVVSGRRRRGKSYLLQALTAVAGGIYFPALEVTEAVLAPVVR